MNALKSWIKMGLLLVAAVMTISSIAPGIVWAESNDKIQKIEQYVKNQQSISKIPGISLVIVEKGETVYQKGFGYANVKTKTPVTSDTLFEIGSTTKAFTGLAILQLEKQGLLHRTDNVQKYIPWLELTYHGEPQKITINQLLHHTSGIASNTITRIPESKADNALELTVKTLQGQTLNRKPGSSFEYATINYDVLGLIIEVVSSMPYEQYMKQHILDRIGMTSSFVGVPSTQPDHMASGYKIGWMNHRPFTPPIYRGNTPAGYIVSNANDIAKWIKLQLKSAPEQVNDPKLIEESHNPDNSVNPFDQNTYYANGWAVMSKSKEKVIFHAGENPSFTSYFILQPDQQLGMAILANMNTSYTTAIGQGVMDLWKGQSPAVNHTDSYQLLDRIVSILEIIVILFGVLWIALSAHIVRKLAVKQRRRSPLTGKRKLLLLIHICMVAAVLIFISMLPTILLGGLPWAFIQVWAPTSIPVFLYSVVTASILYFIYGLLLLFTKKMKNR
ncbi:serine hydrolase domain-containing protein [Paenibacillus cellulositrophicus]|uniref:serine hydrolase domain-containing protein n=1 Tax=Paenibacillus cellulositrophicus TaxID=562959 RepID=UPI001FCBB8BA|nr:serine hydrolase domain-containing protein [Paenibacillus cellulositrophicus]